MTALIIILSILAVFALLFSIPLHVVIEVAEDVSVKARVLFVKVPIFPRKPPVKKKKKGKKSAKKAISEKKSAPKTAPKKKPKRDILGLVKLISKLAVAVLKKFPRHFRVTVLRYEVNVATGDAAKTALLYGGVTALSSHLFELLRHATRFRIPKKAPVGIYADFLGEKPSLRAKIDFSVTLWGALHMVMAAGIAFVKAKMNANTAKKPQASNETQVATSKK